MNLDPKAFYRMYKELKADLNFVMDDIFFGDGDIFRADFDEQAITDVPLTEEEFIAGVGLEHMYILNAVETLGLVGARRRRAPT